jgi:hypothetical protein
MRTINSTIKYINDPFVNLGEVLVDGISFGASYSTKEYGWGKIDIETDWTYLYNYAVQNINTNSAIVSTFGRIALQPYEFRKPVEITPETPKPGYDKDGKKLAGEKAIAPQPEGAHISWIRYWLAGSKITFGINNVFDTPPPFADTFVGYDPQTTNPIGRFFYFELEKKF